MLRGTFGRAGATLLLGAALVATAAPAAAHHKPGHTGGPGSNCPNPAGKYPPGQRCPAQADVSDASTTPNQQVRWYAEGYKPGSAVTLTMYSTPTPMGVVRADSFGFAERTLTIASDAALGSHRIVSTGVGLNDMPLTLTVPITVTAAGGVGAGTGGGNGGSGTGGGIGLPRTGEGIAATAALGLALAGAGSFAVLAGRRRRTTLA